MANINEPTVKTKYLFCNKCRGETEHTCDSEHYRDYPLFMQSEYPVIVERKGYRFWICSGCKTGSLEEYYILDATSDAYDDESTWEFKYHPSRNEFQINSKDFKQLDDQLSKIYKETLGAYNNNLSVLCALGVRSLLEGICADKKIAGKTLRQKIDNMNMILPTNIVSNLHSIRFIGNEAAHQLTPPSKDEIRLAIELCEDLLNFLYELDYKGKALAAARAARKMKLAKTAAKTKTPKASVGKA